MRFRPLPDGARFRHRPVTLLLANKYVSTIVTLFFGFLLSLGGYNNIWALFGSANQLLGALVLNALAVFLIMAGREGCRVMVAFHCLQKLFGKEKNKTASSVPKETA